MIHQVVLSDRAFNIIEDITNKVSGLSWGYNRIGGCAGFSFRVPERFCREVPIGLNYNVKIYAYNASSGGMDLWYQGRVENKRSNIKGIEEVITVQGFGYQSQLSDIYIDADYSSTAIEDIVDDIMDTYVTSNTNITKGTISATSFTADTLEINTDALKAIQTCADIVGFEWQVDENRNFTFQAKSTSTGYRYSVGRKILEVDIDYDSKDLVNRIIITGGDVGGSPFTRTANDTDSQNKWGRRDKALQNSAIVTNAVADQYATAIFADKATIQRRAKVKILDDTQFESTIPLPQFELLTDTDTFGTIKFNTGLFNKMLPFTIERIQYNLDNYGNLTATLQLEKPLPTEFEELAKLDFKLEQLRQQGV